MRLINVLNKPHDRSMNCYELSLLFVCRLQMCKLKWLKAEWRRKSRKIEEMRDAVVVALRIMRRLINSFPRTPIKMSRTNGVFAKPFVYYAKYVEHKSVESIKIGFVNRINLRTNNAWRSEPNVHHHIIAAKKRIGHIKLSNWQI